MGAKQRVFFHRGDSSHIKPNCPLLQSGSKQPLLNTPQMTNTLPSPQLNKSTQQQTTTARQATKRSYQ